MTVGGCLEGILFVVPRAVPFAFDAWVMLTVEIVSIVKSFPFAIVRSLVSRYYPPLPCLALPCLAVVCGLLVVRWLIVVRCHSSSLSRWFVGEFCIFDRVCDRRRGGECVV